MDLSSLVINREWSLHRPNGELRSPSCYFEPGGRIEGYVHPNEGSWSIVDGELRFHHRSGEVTARSGSVSEHADGRWMIAMMRVDDPGVIAHFLYEVALSPCVAGLRSATQLQGVIAGHGAFAPGSRVGSAGFALPRFDAFEVLEVTQANRAVLEARGVRVKGSVGCGNHVVLAPDSAGLSLDVTFHGASRNLLVLARDCRLKGALNMSGNNNLLVAGAACRERDVKLDVEFRYGNAALFIGENCSAGHLHVWLEGPSRSVQIGEDFMASWGVWLRTADSHGLVDLQEGTVLNAPRSIVVEPHVWIGQDAIVMPGVSIGTGSVVGARAVVTRSVEANCVVAGVPARVLRQHTSWTRTAMPDADEIARLQARQRSGGPTR